MSASLIHDRGRGPELVGTRITVYNLMPYFTDPTVTEEQICQLCNLTKAQVAAARAYVFEHADVVLAQHLKIEERNAQGNSPEVREKAQQAGETLRLFKKWYAEQHFAEPGPGSLRAQLPAFQQWLAEQQASSVE